MEKLRNVSSVFVLVACNVIFYTLYFVFSFLCIPLLTVFVIVSFMLFGHRKGMRRYRRAISWYGKVVIYVLPFPFLKIEYKDYERKNNDSGPYIFVCNHVSASDAFLMAVLPYECVQVGNKWPFRVPVLGLIAKWAGYLSVNEMPFGEFFEKSSTILRNGASIIVFPEGTRSGGRKVGQFYSSIFRVAQKVKCPIVPLCISGNERVPPVGSFLLYPSKIKIHKMVSLKPSEYDGWNAFKLKNRVRDLIISGLETMAH